MDHEIPRHGELVRFDENNITIIISETDSGFVGEWTCKDYSLSGRTNVFSSRRDCLVATRREAFSHVHEHRTLRYGRAA